jgi:hypothetical protein
MRAMNQSSTELQQNKKDLTICANLNREVVLNILQHLHKIQKLDKIFSDNLKLTQLIEQFSALISNQISESPNEYIAWYQKTFAETINEFAEFIRTLTHNSDVPTNNHTLLELEVIIQDIHNTQQNINKIIG